MAHFAKIGLDNVVLTVLAVDDKDTATDGGIERESIGIAYLQGVYGHDTWKQCSYNTERNTHRLGGTPFRANYPGAGHYYNSEHDIFHGPRPTDKDGDACNSFTLNSTTGLWDPPITAPVATNAEATAGKRYLWDESAYKADNAQGWILSDS